MKRMRRNYLLWVRIIRPSLIILLLLIPPVLAHFLPRIVHEPLADTLTLSMEPFSGTWFSVVHFSSNAVFSWRLDPFLKWALDARGAELFFSFCLLVFCSGAFLFSLELNGRRQPVLSAAGVSVAGAGFVLMFGYDTFVITSVVWLPWVMYLLHLILVSGRRSPPYFIFLLLAAFRLCRASNQFSLFFVLLAFAVIFFLAPQRHKVAAWTSFMILLLPAFWTAVSAPAVPLPLYPPFARVLENRVPMLAGGDALVGPVPAFRLTPVQILDRAFLRPFLEPVCFVLLLIAAVSALDVWRTGRHVPEERRTVFCISTLVLAASCVLDTGFVSASVSQISPLYALPRILPGLQYFPFIYLAIGLTIFFVGMLLVAGRAWDILLLLAGCLVIPAAWGGWDKECYVQRPSATMPWKELSKAELKPAERAARTKTLMSPSYGLVLENSPGFFERFPNVSREMNLVPLFRFAHTITASVDPEKIYDVIRGAQSRWSSGNGSQRGGEWVHIRLDAPMLLKGMQLDLGGFETDYPRGLEIRYSEFCESGNTQYESYKPVFKRRQWRGETAYTADGFPYMEPEAEVVALFEQPAYAQCLLIMQTGRSRQFEWSITGIRLGQ